MHGLMNWPYRYRLCQELFIVRTLTHRLMCYRSDLAPCVAFVWYCCDGIHLSSWRQQRELC